MKLHLAELRRRGIFKALAAYAVASWVLVEVVSIIAPAFLLPPWTVAAVATVFVLGAFPVLLLAWRYELTDAGLARDESLVPDEVDRSARTLATVFLLGLLGATSLLWVNYFRVQPEETVHSLTETQRGAPEIDADGLIRSIAVLPFEDFSLTPTNSLFADGIAEAILHILAQDEDLTVTARTSSFYFRDKDLTAAQIGKILGVQALLEGSVQVVDNRLKVTSQLVRTSDQTHLWSEVYEAPLDNIFQLQNQIAQTVHNRVSGSTPGQVALDRDDHPSVEAYQLLLEAKRNLEGSSLETTDEAIRLLRLAIELSPQYAEAHVLLSEALSAKMVGLDSRGKPSNRSLFDEAKRETELALQLDPNNARALLQHGAFSQSGGSGKEYQQAYEDVLALAPNDPEVLAWLSSLEVQKLDLAAAEALITRARAVDPSDFGVFMSHLGWLCINEPISPLVETQLTTFSASAAAAQSARAYAYWCDDRYADYAQAMLLLMRINQEPLVPFQFLFELSELGHPGALKVISKAHMLVPEWFRHSIHDETVFFPDVESDRLTAYRWHQSYEYFHPYFTPVSLALLHIQLGNLEAAKESLDRAQAAWESFFAYEGDRQIQRETLAIYAYQAWILLQEGDIAEGQELAQELLAVVDTKRLADWSLAPRFLHDVSSDWSPSFLHDVPLLILLLNDETARAIQWVADAERYRWDYFQIVVTSPIYAEFRNNTHVQAMLKRMASRRERKIAEINSIGAPEIMEPSLLLAEIQKREPNFRKRAATVALELDRDAQAAARILEAALREDPSDASALTMAWKFCVRLQRHSEAITLAESIVELEPDEGSSYIELGNAYLFAGHLEESRESFHRGVELLPDYTYLHRWIAVVDILRGDAQSALLELDKVVEEDQQLIGKAIVYHALGNEQLSKSALLELIEEYAADHAFAIAYVHAFRGDSDGAFQWLKRYTQNGLLGDEFASHPLFASLGKDPRWSTLLRENGLAPEQVERIQFSIPINVVSQRETDAAR